MSLTHRIALWQDKHVLSRLLEFYQYDMCEFAPSPLNDDGEFGFDVDAYLLDPSMRAYIFMVSNHLAGFGLVDRHVKLPASEHWMAQFFIMKHLRRDGIGTQAAHTIFKQFGGQWEVGQLHNNRPAQLFWRRAIASFTGGSFVEHQLHDHRWHGCIQTFESPRT